MKTEELLEQMNELDDRYLAEYSEETIKTQRKGLGRKRQSIIAACLAVALVATGVLAVQHFNASDGALLVNEIEIAEVQMDLDVQQTSYSGKLTEQAWNNVTAEFASVTGIEYLDFIGRIPEKFTGRYQFYSLAAPKVGANEPEKQYALHDFVLSYQAAPDQNLTIAICKEEPPLRDYLIDCAAPQLSEVNRTTLTVYGDQDCYIVQCVYQGANYDIETTGYSLDEVELLLTNLLV